MATKLAMTVTVKAIDSQRWICRTHVFQFIETSCEDEPKRNAADSINPRQHLLQICEELLPSVPGAAKSLLLIRPKTRLLHAQESPRARWRERKGHLALQIVGRILVRKIPGVGQRLVRLDGEHLAIQHAAPVSAKIETVTHGRLEVVLHQPLLDQMRLRERAPDLFRRMRDLAFDNDRARFGRSFVHWSILLSRSSRSSNRLCQKPAIWLVQSVSGAKARSCAL